MRIFAMLLVLIGHYNHFNGVVDYDLVHNHLWKAIGIAEMKAWTFTCVPLFIVISGYFGIRWKWKGLANYLFQIGFWGGLVYLIGWVLGMYDFATLTFVKNMTCFLHGVNWFFTAYLGLYMLSPILNAFIDKASERQMMWMTLVFFGYQAVFGWMFRMGEFADGLTTTSLIGWYLIGGWLRKSTWRGFHLKPWQNMGVFLGIGVVCVALNIATRYVGVGKDVFSNISPLQAAQTTYLFLFCRSLTIRKGKRIVTFFASSAFAGLLMHSWKEGGDLYYPVIRWLIANTELSFIWCMSYIFLFFTAACTLDKLRLWCWNRIANKVF